jgi:hypothetical protein
LDHAHGNIDIPANSSRRIIHSLLKKLRLETLSDIKLPYRLEQALGIFW